MRERAEQILKIVCACLGLVLALQLGKLAIQPNPLAGVTIPDLPSLPAETNAIASVTTRPPTKLDATNAAKTKDSKTNAALMSADTNTVSQSKAKTPGTGTNDSASASVSAASMLPATNTSPTNAIALVSTNTQARTNKPEAGTNAVVADAANTNGASASVKKHSKKGGDLPPGMMAGLSGGKSPKLAPGIQARVDRITDSEILGPVIHPMPMALLGIAGNVAFLRSPSGQTGLVKEGEDLGEIKLLRIGVNRVLVEQNGEKKELMIFAGLGGESLLPKPTESSDETTNRK
jgi:hypothetical protein